ncbi:PAS domain S-box-containing protein [Amycolatopsis bartoniae]|uniref:MEKHLA domain-containing protein n=1 Tax=Amycolatopsis bartoniae TaxID=941986 RepID=A0A8H9M472_9PSEU|nr:MEKHLA domain-containing protein [Amycolatopsis bartoniae]MBB2934674.1 PAS domain S-box-containing protein [Amycolatopsis bartoniae]TVT09332.1 MEKHLA domain-containing protein [Amycolatopsis bartoniae]GHF45631.1 MEKHLA domain-containing protein [Amycolatopsis bartoniae]
MKRDEDFAQLLNSSHERVVGRPLLPGGSPDARWLYEDAPFVLLAHDTSDDPLFVYANRMAQRCFEYSWDEFVGLPSRLSAEAPDRDERDRLMAGVRRQGFVESYRGLRIAKSGRRFWLEDATVWNLVDADGALRGQAARVPRWSDHC